MAECVSNTSEALDLTPASQLTNKINLTEKFWLKESVQNTEINK